MSRAIGTLVVSSVLLFAIGLKADDKPTTSKGKTLPPGWSKLGLSEDQKKQVYKVRGEFRDKIDELKQQISALEKEERSQASKLLTPAQRTRLKELVLSKQIGDDEPIQGKQESPKQEAPAEKPKEKPAGKEKQEAPPEKPTEKPAGKEKQEAPKQNQDKPGKEKQEAPKEKQENPKDTPKEKQEKPKDKDQQ